MSKIMSERKKIKTALVSVYHKEGLDEIITRLHDNGVKFLSTGGTRQFIESMGYECEAVEDLTSYPSILGGRVKTLHPKVFGGILCRRDMEQDRKQVEQYEIPEIDLVIVDLYPFEATVASGASEADIIEKIDIGGISLIRAGAKNFKDVVIVASQAQYQPLLDILCENGASTSLEERAWFAKEAFGVSSYYDTAIFNYFDKGGNSSFRCAVEPQKVLRYGENPHQRGMFFGDFDAMFDQLHGKEISYNNLLDINAAVDLIDEFDETTFAVLKHNNACGLASRPTLVAVLLTRLRPRRSGRYFLRSSSRPTMTWTHWRSSRRRRTASSSSARKSSCPSVNSARCSTACSCKTATPRSRHLPT